MKQKKTRDKLERLKKKILADKVYRDEEKSQLSVWNINAHSEHHPLEFLFQRNISACRAFTKHSTTFLEKEVCDARGNVFNLFHSIILQLVQAPLPSVKLLWLRTDSGLICILLSSYSTHSNENVINPNNACLRYKRTWFVFLVNNPNRETYQSNMNSSLVPTIQKAMILFIQSSFLLHHLLLEQVFQHKKYLPPLGAKK